MKIPTYEEFYKAVKDNFKYGWPNLSDKRVDEYLQSEEGRDIINERYGQGVRDIKNGKSTYEQIMIGRASSAGYCLELMYEPNEDYS